MVQILTAKPVLRDANTYHISWTRITELFITKYIVALERTIEIIRRHRGAILIDKGPRIVHNTEYTIEIDRYSVQRGGPYR